MINYTDNLVELLQHEHGELLESCTYSQVDRIFVEGVKVPSEFNLVLNKKEYPNVEDVYECVKNTLMRIITLNDSSGCLQVFHPIQNREYTNTRAKPCYLYLDDKNGLWFVESSYSLVILLESEED